MNSLPSPQSIRVAFDSRAEAEAAYIDAGITSMFIGDLMYREGSDGLAIQTNGGTRDWEPMPGQISPLHYADNPTPITGTADLTDAWQSAINFAASLNTNSLIGMAVRVDGRGQKYGISQQTAQGGLIIAGHDGVLLENAELNAIGTWTDADIDMLYVTSDGSNKARNIRLKNIHFECNKLCSAITYDDTAFGLLEDVTGHAMLGHGVRAITNNTEFHLSRVAMKEWLYEELPDGGNDQDQRTSVGFQIDTADGWMHECNATLCRISLTRASGYNFQITNFHPWNGAVVSNEDPDEQYLMYLDNPYNLLVSQGYFDHGNIYVNADTLKSNFGSTQTLQIVNAIFTRNASKLSESPRIILMTSVADNDLAGLTLIGCTFSVIDTYSIEFRTTGSGSYAYPLKYTAFGARKFDGQLPSTNLGYDLGTNAPDMQYGTYSARLEGSGGTPSSVFIMRWNRYGEILRLSGTVFGADTSGITGTEVRVPLPPGFEVAAHGASALAVRQGIATPASMSLGANVGSFVARSATGNTYLTIECIAPGKTMTPVAPGDCTSGSVNISFDVSVII